MSQQYKFFTQRLLQWNTDQNDRPMPWKGEKNPYRIWLSEIILQQTRVEQGWEYYKRFIAAFPDVNKLAKASENSVFKLWEGLGYYTRCKNLITTAKYIAKEKKGQFPGTYEGILSLKGVGPYTAAAIASFAYDLPHAVLDGNVFRVLSRFFGIETPIDSTAGKKIFTQLAGTLLDKKQPGIYNQALMDFGAVLCKPRSPLCPICPLQAKCVAYQTNKVNALPIKEKSITKRSRWMYYLLVQHAGKFYVRKRGPKDIWENLYEFILIESDTTLAVENITSHPAVKKMLGNNKAIIEKVSGVYRQQLTHQSIQGQFIQIKVTGPLVLEGYETVSQRQLEGLPFPKFITGYLQDKNVSLNLF